MKIVQLIKKLNNTELGKTGTHETYIQVPQDLEISDIFPEYEDVKNFVYKKTGKIYYIRATSGREKRIVGLGDFYRDNDVCAGDEVVLEVHIAEDDDKSYFIDLNKRDDILMIQKCKSGFELLNAERKQLITSSATVFVDGAYQPIEIEFISSERKRSDSPVTTDIYDVKVGGNSIVENYSGKEMVEIQVEKNANRAFLNRICAWKKYLFEMEGYDE